MHLKTELAVTQQRFLEKVSFDDALTVAWNGTRLSSIWADSSCGSMEFTFV
jgi:hypothetical protein